MRIGYNVNLSAINNQAQEDAILSNADKHLLMTDGHNPSPQIQVWKDALGADKIVWRKYDQREGNWTEFNNGQVISEWIADGHRDVIRDDPSNEPSLGGTDQDNNERYVKHSVDLLNRANNAGFTVAIGAFSVGTPHESMIDNGTYDDLIRAVVEGGHYISVHEYCPGIPGAGDVFPYAALSHPESVLSEMLTNQWALDEYWLLRRSDRFVKRARQLGLADPRIIITECFIDYIPDASTILQKLRPPYGIAEYNNDLRGVLAWRDYYHVAFDGLDYELIVDRLTEYLAHKVYNQSWIHGACLFALNNLWDTPQGHNWLNARLDTFRRVFLPAINSQVTEPPEPEPPEPGPHEILYKIDYEAFSTIMTHNERLIEMDRLENIIERDQKLLNALQNAKPVT